VHPRSGAGNGFEGLPEVVVVPTPGATMWHIFCAVRAFCELHRNPTSPGPGGDPHRNPTNETEHCGTLVTLVKSIDNPVEQPLCA
jgi:hypothetical protein